MMEATMASEIGGNAVGYKNPPRHRRYQKGFSGNPKGRPKGSQTAVSILGEVLRQMARITEGNTTRQITKAEALIKVIFVEAIKGTRQYADVLVTICDSIQRLVENPLARPGAIALVPGVAKSNEEFEQMLREEEEDRAREDEMQKLQKAAEVAQLTSSARLKLPPRNVKRRTASSPPMVKLPAS
jgi:hypothetical protein